MISFDRLAKSNGVGWSQESIVVALCLEIGELRKRILALEAVSHAPVPGFVRVEPALSASVKLGETLGQEKP